MDGKMKNKQTNDKSEQPVDTKVIIQKAMHEFGKSIERATVSKGLGVGQETRLNNDDKSIISGFGPKKTKPFSSQILEKFEFSAKNPYPG